MKTRADFRRTVQLGFIVAASSFCASSFADEVFPVKEAAPQSCYELHYLGYKEEKDSHPTLRIGIFQLIWKADSPTKFLAIVSPGGEEISPTPDFVVHLQPGMVPQSGIYKLAPGWLWVGRTGIEAPGTEWIALQPGQVLTLATPVSSIEKGLRWFTSVPDAKGDRARLVITTKTGMLISDDINLPLLPVPPNP